MATNDVHYLRQGDYQPHDILLCIGTGKTVNDAQRLRYTGDQFFLKTPEQMAAVFRDHPEALRNTMLVAERCNVTIPVEDPEVDVVVAERGGRAVREVTRNGVT